MWARVHKIDRIKPQPNGSAVILVEDERTTAQMSRVPGMTTVVAIARVLNAKKVLAAKYNGKGQVRYAANATLPPFLFDAVSRAGAAIADRAGEVICPPQPANVASVVDLAMSELAHWTRTNVGASDMAGALKRVEATRRAAPLDREAKPELYWPAVFELASLAGELSRSRGGRWIETNEMPVPYAIKFADGAEARPIAMAQRIVEGGGGDESVSDAIDAQPMPAHVSDPPKVVPSTFAQSAPVAAPAPAPVSPPPSPAAPTSDASEADSAAALEAELAAMEKAAE